MFVIPNKIYREKEKLEENGAIVNYAISIQAHTQRTILYFIRSNVCIIQDPIGTPHGGATCIIRTAVAGICISFFLHTAITATYVLFMHTNAITHNVFSSTDYFNI